MDLFADKLLDSMRPSSQYITPIGSVPRKISYPMIGRFLPKPVACSNACAICRTLKSSLLRPTICTPTGSPSGVKPPGTEAAGFPVAETYQQDFIQSI